MTNNRSYSDDFDYDSLKRRITAASAKKERIEKAQFIREYFARCARRFSETKARAPKSAVAEIYQSTTTFVKSESTHMALASLILVAFLIWIGNALYVQYAEQNERAFAQKCSRNKFSHSSNLICYDQHGYVHTLNPDGTTRKGALDWNVWRQTDFANRVANPD